DVTRRTPPELTSIRSYRQAFIDHSHNIQASLSAARPHFMQALARDPAAHDTYAMDTQAATRTIHNLVELGVGSGEFSIDSSQLTSRIIQQSMESIQQGTYSDILKPQETYPHLGRLILNGISKN